MNVKLNRRTLIKRVVYALLSLQILYIISSLLKGKKKTTSNHEWFEAGEVHSFEKNTVYPFGSAQFYLSKLDDGGMLAISTQCTHLGCAIQFHKSKDRFICPCHASAFNKYGEVLSPPATRALDIYPIAIENNKVMVNLSKPIKRTQYEASQLTYI